MFGLWRGVWGAASSSPSSCFSSSSSSLRPSSSLPASPSVLSVGAASSSWSFQHRRLAGGAISAPWFSQFTSSAFFSSSASSCAAAPTLSKFPTAKELIRNNPSVLDPYCTFENNLSRVPFAFDLRTTNALKALKKAKLTAVADGNGFGFLETEEPFFSDMKSSKVLFVRQFYPRLFAHIRQLRRVVLIGNPGIAKSVFQAYYIHQLLQPGPLPLNHFKSTTPPKVVLRQVGQGKMQVMFLEEELVFTVKEPGIGLVEAFNPETTEYLMEPAGENFEPFFDGLTLPIRASCSPNDSRYKEFTKNGALEAFMPCWTLEELLLAGRVLRERKKEPDGVSFSDEQIINRFNQFGGIIRYVLPSLSGYVDLIQRRQAVAASESTQRSRILSQYPDIAVRQGYTTEISHHLMQYVVDYDTFLPLRLKVASKPVLNIIAMAISDNDFAEGCSSLKRMFNGRQTERPDVFELMVTQGIARQYFVWHIHLDGHWQPFYFPKMKIQRLAKDKTPTFAEMQAGLLYRIDDCLFPLVDMFYKSADDEVTGIQVTFAASHAKPAAVFQLFRARLQLPPHVRCRVLMVPSPTHAEAYAQRQPADHVAATRASKQGATDEERSHLIDEASTPDREAKKKAKAEFLQQAKFDIATLQLTWPSSTD